MFKYKNIDWPYYLPTYAACWSSLEESFRNTKNQIYKQLTTPTLLICTALTILPNTDKRNYSYYEILTVTRNCASNTILFFSSYRFTIICLIYFNFREKSKISNIYNRDLVQSSHKMYNIVQKLEINPW